MSRDYFNVSDLIQIEGIIKDVEMNKVYTRDNLPGPWVSYVKRVPTKMVRIEGPFTVQTREGLMHCSDGFLALDSNGDPYPIAADVQAATYLPLSPKNQSER